MIFNVGARRSGTYWLQRVVTAHPQVASVPSETHLFSHGIAPLMERFHHTIKGSPQVGSGFIELEQALDAVRDLCDAFFEGYLTDDAARLAERTPLHVNHLSLIASIYPDAQFIHIIRDGRDVTRSLAAQNFGPDSVAEAAREWRTAIEDARGAKLDQSRYIEVRYEDLLLDPRPTVESLYTWLGLDANPQVVEQGALESQAERNVDRFQLAGTGTDKWRQVFGARDLAEFNSVAGDLIADLDYDPADPKTLPERSPLSQRRTLRGGIRTIASRTRSRRDQAVAADPFRLKLEIVEGVIAAMRDSDPEPLDRHLTQGAMVRVIDAEGGERAARGEAGRELLSKAVLSDRVFGLPQIRGDLYPGTPSFTVMLTIRARAEVAHRLLIVELRGERIAELTIHQLGDPSP